MWTISVSSVSFQITILAIEADKFFLRWNWMHGFISCLPCRVPDSLEFLFSEILSAFSVMFFVEIVVLEERQIWLCHDTQGAVGAHSSGKSYQKNVFSSLFPNFRFLGFWDSRQAYLISAAVFSSTLPLTNLKTLSLSLARPQKKVWFLKRSLCFLNSTQLFSEPRLGSRLPDYSKKLFLNKQVLKLSLKAVSSVQKTSTKSQM